MGVRAMAVSVRLASAPSTPPGRPIRRKIAAGPVIYVAALSALLLIGVSAGLLVNETDGESSGDESAPLPPPPGSAGSKTRAISLAGGDYPVTTLAMGATGDVLVSGSRDRLVRLWDTASGKQKGAPLRGHTDVVTAVALNPSASVAVSGSLDRTVRLWNVRTGEPLGEALNGAYGFAEVAISPDGAVVAAADEAGRITLWDMKTRDVIARIAGGNEVRDRPSHPTRSVSW